MTVVYTAIFAESDRLKPAPRGADRCICFRDTPGPETEQGWEIGLWPVDGDPRAEAWRLRAVADTLFPTADGWLWVDGSFGIRDLPRLLADAVDAPLVGLRHPDRTSCYAEAAALVAAGKARRAGVEAQMDLYRAEGFAPAALTTAGVLLRRNTEAVRRFNRLWAEALRSYPDDNAQLSLDYCAWKAGLAVHYLEGTYRENPYVTFDHADHKARHRAYA